MVMMVYCVGWGIGIDVVGGGVVVFVGVVFGVI
jgi:hypothetical protein